MSILQKKRRLHIRRKGKKYEIVYILESLIQECILLSIPCELCFMVCVKIVMMINSLSANQKKISTLFKLIDTKRENNDAIGVMRCMALRLTKTRWHLGV